MHSLRVPQYGGASCESAKTRPVATPPATRTAAMDNSTGSTTAGAAGFFQPEIDAAGLCSGDGNRLPPCERALAPYPR